MHDRLRSAPDAVVLVPVKAFGQAKERLAGALAAPARAALARSMAEVVLAAANGVGVRVVCDDVAVAEWATGHGAGVLLTTRRGLNEALDDAARQLVAEGVRRMVVCHADLPFARGLDRLAARPPHVAVVVPDRRDDGTNVLSLPLPEDPAHLLPMLYGPRSAEAHARVARAAGLSVEVLHDEHLAWDVDVPADLHPPAHLGAMPEVARAR